MKLANTVHRRHFLRLGTLASAAIGLPLQQALAARHGPDNITDRLDKRSFCPALNGDAAAVIMNLETHGLTFGLNTNNNNHY